MKSLSLKLVKGVISGVDSTVRVTWVIPRVMDRDSIKKQLVKLSDWMDKVTSLRACSSSRGVIDELVDCCQVVMHRGCAATLVWYAAAGCASRGAASHYCEMAFTT
jgi:hypothetical protein